MPLAVSSASRSTSISLAVMSMSLIGSAAMRTQRGGASASRTAARIRSRNWLALAKNSGADQRTMSSPGTCDASGIALDVVPAGHARARGRGSRSTAPTRA